MNNKLRVSLKVWGGVVLRYMSNNKSILESIKECGHYMFTHGRTYIHEYTYTRTKHTC